MRKIIITVTVLFASITANAQWTHVNLPDSLPVYSIYFVNDSTGFAASCWDNLSVWSAGLIYKTTDRGNTWQMLSPMLGYCKSSVFFIDEHTGYSSGTIVIKTIDGGTNWFFVGPNSGVNSNFIYFINDSIGFINGSWVFSSHVIRKTTDGGTSWVASASFNPPSNIASVCFTSSQVGFAVGHDSSIVLKTTDGGVNWNPVSTQYSLESVHFPSANDGYAAGFNGTIIHSIDSGNTWSQLVSGTAANIHSLYCPSFNTCYAVGDSGTILKTIDGGNTWAMQNSGTVQKLRSVCCTSSYCYAAGDSGVILRTANTTSIGENIFSPINLISVFPNPTTNELTVINNSNHNLQFTIYNLLGDQIIQQMLIDKQTKINFSSYSNGIYFFKVTRDNFIETGKLIKQ